MGYSYGTYRPNVLYGTGDGFCTWDIIRTGGAPYSLVTGNELVAAATQMLDECVRDNRGMGGIATHIGAWAL